MGTWSRYETVVEGFVVGEDLAGLGGLGGKGRGV